MVYGETWTKHRRNLNLLHNVNIGSSLSLDICQNNFWIEVKMDAQMYDIVSIFRETGVIRETWTSVPLVQVSP